MFNIWLLTLFTEKISSFFLFRAIRVWPQLCKCWITPVADPGEGDPSFLPPPSLFLDQTEARRAEKKTFLTPPQYPPPPPPPNLRIWMSAIIWRSGSANKHYPLHKLLYDCIRETNCVIHRIEIYPVDNAILLLNNWNQMCSYRPDIHTNFK